jgi:hypothetical protein
MQVILLEDRGLLGNLGDGQAKVKDAARNF